MRKFQLNITIFSISTFSPYIQIIPRTETSGREATKLASKGSFLESSDIRTIIPAETINFTMYQIISVTRLLILLRLQMNGLRGKGEFNASVVEALQNLNVHPLTEIHVIPMAGGWYQYMHLKSSDEEEKSLK